MADEAAIFEERLKDGTLHLSEWESLDIEEYDNFRGLRDAISPKEGDKCKELSVYDYYGAKIKTSYYVGAMGLESAIPVIVGEEQTHLCQVIITPKICHARDGWPDFLRMLEVAYRIKIPDLVKKADLSSIKDLRLILALVYARAVEELLKKHLRRNYVIRVDNLNGRVKGKLLLTPYIRQQVAKGQPQIAVCQYYELTPDTLLNRIIKAGLRSAKRLVAVADIYKTFSGISVHLTRQLSLFGNVADVRVTRADFARVHLHARNRYYETPLQLARMLLFANRFEYESGDNAVFGFFMDMNDLFERFVAGLFNLSNYGVEYQPVLHFNVAGENKTIKPDIKLLQQDRVVYIDAKYKDIFEKDRVTDEETLIETDYGGSKVKVATTDLYQIIAYLDNTESGSNNGVLVYPWIGSNIMFPVKSVTGFGGKIIKLIGINLSDIDGLTRCNDELRGIINRVQ